MLASWVVLALVVAAVPLAIRTIASTLFGDKEATLYDLVAGREVPPVVTARPESNQTFVNIAIVDLDAMTGDVKLAVSGNRHCEIPCNSVTMTFLALDDNPAQRRGLPPGLQFPWGRMIGSLVRP